MKLTPELQEQIVKYIKSGNYIETACDAVSINKQTYYNWLERGEKGEQPFLGFLDAIKKAKAEAIMRNVLIIQTAAPKNWQAAGWWLERTCYKLFGRKEQLGGIADEPLKFEVEILNGNKKHKGE